MKKFLFIAIALTCFHVISRSQAGDDNTSAATLKALSAEFKSPPPETGIILWWGRDGQVNDSVIRQDLDRIKDMGFTGVMIEAGYGMTTKYLSGDWFRLVGKAVQEARKRNMKVWIEDEGKYPSGFAGGKFSLERPDLKMQGLVVTQKISADGGQKILEKLPSYALSAVAFNNNDKSSIILNISTGILDWDVPSGNWQILVAGNRFRSSVTRSVNNPSRGKDTTASLMDYLNPLATKQFLQWTHEEYKKVFGDEFGKTFQGFMGDEPDFAYTPFTPGITEEFKRIKGYDIKPYLASFFLPQLTEEQKQMKADYWDVWSSLFGKNFFSVQAEWCRKNNISYIVHLNHEDQLTGLSKSSGDFFRNMRNVGVPGVDAIWAQIWMDHVADYPKLASSAAHIYGKQRAFTESFAAYTHKPSVMQAKWVLDYQLVRGINSIQVMFMSASTQKQAPSPASKNFFQSDSFPPVARYLNRATFMLSQGKPAAGYGIYFPTLSFWYGDQEANSSLLEISRIMAENRYDYDFVDEQALATLLHAGNGRLSSDSGVSYKAIIVPAISAISETALNRLREFASTGGRVIFASSKPFLSVGKSFLHGVPFDDLSWASVLSPEKLEASVSTILPRSDLRINVAAPGVKYLHRTFSDGDMYFLFNEKAGQVSFRAAFNGKGKAEVWDAMSGKISTLKDTKHTSDGTEVSLNLNGWETKMIVIRK